MHLTSLLLPTLLALLPNPALSKHHNHSPQTTTITLRIPASAPNLPNPSLLPPSTRATLTTLGAALSAPLSTANTFVFRNVSRGSYLVDVHCLTQAFAPLRLDVFSLATGEGEGDGTEKLGVQAWETYRGNDWGNKGEGVAVVAIGEGEKEGRGVVVEVRGLGGKGYFLERSSFSVLSIFKNPIILLSLVSMALFFGMPKLVENMDPEMRAEWEERQKENPMNAFMGAASGGNSNPMGNFDMAAFLAGSSNNNNNNNKAEEGNGGRAKVEGKKKR